MDEQAAGGGGLHAPEAVQVLLQGKSQVPADSSHLTDGRTARLLEEREWTAS